MCTYAPETTQHELAGANPEVLVAMMLHGLMVVLFAVMGGDFLVLGCMAGGNKIVYS